MHICVKEDLYISEKKYDYTCKSHPFPVIHQSFQGWVFASWYQSYVSIYVLLFYWKKTKPKKKTKKPGFTSTFLWQSVLALNP